MKRIMAIVLIFISLFFWESPANAKAIFPTYAPTYFAGLLSKAMVLSTGSECTDGAKQVYWLAGKGTFGNNYPGVNVFEKAAGTCGSSTGFTTKISSISINGFKAEIWSNCAGVSKCTTSVIQMNGGLIRWVQVSKSGQKTAIDVTGYNLPYRQLLAVAKGITKI